MIISVGVVIATLLLAEPLFNEASDELASNETLPFDSAVWQRTEPVGLRNSRFRMEASALSKITKGTSYATLVAIFGIPSTVYTRETDGTGYFEQLFASFVRREGANGFISSPKQAVKVVDYITGTGWDPSHTWQYSLRFAIDKNDSVIAGFRTLE
ncbi:MAG: hypothetical protein M3R13_00720 [Armatimonadota bacterium]|nr:hypothetical protein [Armatimonadota bacterium]